MVISAVVEPNKNGSDDDVNADNRLSIIHLDVGAEIGTPSEDGQEQEHEHEVRQHPSSSPPSTFYIDKMRMAKVCRDGNNDNDINNDNDDTCRRGHNDDEGFPFPFYAKPVQRQRRGSPDLVIHVGWNTLVSSNE